jgi:hypothetical protein
VIPIPGRESRVKWRKQAIALVDLTMSVIAIFRQRGERVQNSGEQSIVALVLCKFTYL